MASNILKNNSFGGPTYFDRWWATCLGNRQDGRAELGWPSSKGKGWRTFMQFYGILKMVHVYFCFLCFDNLGTSIRKQKFKDDVYFVDLRTTYIGLLRAELLFDASVLKMPL